MFPLSSSSFLPANSAFFFLKKVSILALVSGFGFIGAISKQTGFVFLFRNLLTFHLNFSFFTGIYTIYTLFKRIPDAALANCINRSSDQTIIDGCHDGLKILKILVVVAYFVTWLMELCVSLSLSILHIQLHLADFFPSPGGIFIVTSYIQQLREEEAAEMKPPIVAIPNTPMHF
jgi:hypothetical protein